MCDLFGFSRCSGCVTFLIFPGVVWYVSSFKNSSFLNLESKYRFSYLCQNFRHDLTDFVNGIIFEIIVIFCFLWLFFLCEVGRFSKIVK